MFQRITAFILAIGALVVAVYLKRSRLTRWLVIPLIVALIGFSSFMFYRASQDVPFAFADDTGAQTGDGVGIGDGDCSDNWAWSGAGGALSANDTSYVQQTTSRWDDTDIGDYLFVDNFGFTGVSGTVDGVVVDVLGWTPAGSLNYYEVILADDASVATGTNQAAGSFPTSDPGSTYDTFGGVSNDWGVDSLTPSLVMNANFGVYLCWQATANDTTANVDHVTMTVYYTPAAGGQQAVQSVYFFE